MNGRGLQIALAISLIFNVFVVGAFVGAGAMQLRAERQKAQAKQPSALVKAGDALNEKDREAYRDMLKEEGIKVHPITAAAKQARNAAADEFAKPQFDLAAANALLGRARDADVAARGQLETAVVAYAAGLPPDERAALGEGLRRPPPKKQNNR